MPFLYIIRGIPGSGKSTLGEKLVPGCSFSANDWFMEGGKYNYNKDEIAEAHKFCRANVLVSMKNGEPIIAVCNTFTRKWEFEPYIELCNTYGYTPIEIICRGNFKNIHNVPESVIEKMKNRFEY